MIKFGVAGNSMSFYNDGYKHTAEAAEWCAERGIDIFEYSFGKGVRMTKETAAAIGEAFRRSGVELSAHAPYYINFANPDDDKIAASVGYVIQTLTKVREFGFGERVVVHPAAQGKATRTEAVERTKKNLYLLADRVEDGGFSDLKVCLETMGKIGQIGTPEEIVEFCKIAPFFYPCMDFGHINARTGGSLKTAEDYERIICHMLDNLPEEKVRKMHVHFSKIMYGSAGEIKHLTFEDEIYGPEFGPLSEIFIKYNLEPVVICESDGTQAEDTVAMKKIYFRNAEGDRSI